ncbi:hypothetical protein [Allokutzneria oryzae]|uniref:Uncharacterized protein n=1 Tax=Allokutzneria oryzae TaxID=1378989 RepID=A0ABV6A6S3_9PSEU
MPRTRGFSSGCPEGNRLSTVDEQRLAPELVGVPTGGEWLLSSDF